MLLCFNIIRELRNRSYKKTSYVILVLLIIGYFLGHHIFSYFLLVFIAMQLYIYYLAKEYVKLLNSTGFYKNSNCLIKMYYIR